LKKYGKSKFSDLIEILFFTTDDILAEFFALCSIDEIFGI